MPQRPKSFPFRFDAIPCVLSRELIGSLSGTEFKLYVLIMVHTWGFRKSSAAIPLAHFVQGQWSKAGKLIVSGLGVSRSQVIRAIHALESRNLLTVIRKHNNVSVYEPRMNREWVIAEVSPMKPQRKSEVPPMTPFVRQTDKRTARKAPPVTSTIQ